MKVLNYSRKLFYCKYLSQSQQNDKIHSKNIETASASFFKIKNFVQTRNKHTTATTKESACTHVDSATKTVCDWYDLKHNQLK